MVHCLNSYAAAQQLGWQDCGVTGLVRLLRGYQSSGVPGIVIAWELIPWRGGGGGWGRHCSSSAWSGPWHSSFSSLTPIWTMFMSGSYRLISQAGCNRLQSTLLCSTLLASSCSPPWGGGDGGDTAAVLPGLKLSIPFILTCSMDSAHMWELIM